MQEYIEFRAKENEDFSKLLAKYPYSTVGDMTVDSHNRVVTLSKYKIVKSGVASEGRGNNRAIYCLDNGNGVVDGNSIINFTHNINGAIELVAGVWEVKNNTIKSNLPTNIGIAVSANFIGVLLFLNCVLSGSIICDNPAIFLVLSYKAIPTHEPSPIVIIVPGGRTKFKSAIPTFI